MLRVQSEKLQYQQNQVEASTIPSAWMPPRGMGEEIRAINHPSPRIRMVEPLQINDSDMLTILRNTWLGHFYRNSLKPYAVFRWIILWTWRHGYPVYVNFLSMRLFNGKTKRWRPLTKLSEFVKKEVMSVYKLAYESFIETPAPKVFPECYQTHLVSPHECYKYPEIFVAAVSNGMVYGGTNLVLVDDVVVCHDLYDFKHDYTSEEMHGRTIIAPKSKRIRWLLHDKEPIRIPLASTFVDACAPNYAHWLTEVLPRVAIFCADERFKDIPIVVNDGLHKNIMESLFLVAGPEREIITLPIGRAAYCDELYITSVTGYVPFERRTKKLTDYSHGLFSPLAFDVLLNRLIDSEQSTQPVEWPDRIFLRRNSGIRKVVNEAELEKLLTSHGYVVVEPEKLTFSQQVRLFSNARAIVSSSGAAMANMVFSPRDARIIILIGKYPGTSYWYWQNMACASGKTVSYVLGEIIKSNVGGIHASFSVDLDSLSSALSQENRKQ